MFVVSKFAVSHVCEVYAPKSITIINICKLFVSLYIPRCLPIKQTYHIYAVYSPEYLLFFCFWSMEVKLLSVI